MPLYCTALKKLVKTLDPWLTLSSKRFSLILSCLLSRHETCIEIEIVHMSHTHTPIQVYPLGMAEVNLQLKIYNSATSTENNFLS